MIQAFEAGTICGERTASVRRNSRNQTIYRNIEPHRHAVAVDGCTVLRVGERAAAGRDDQMSGRELIEQDRSLDSPEVRFALLRKDLGDGRPLPLLDQLVDVHRLPVEPLRERTRHGRLARRHEPDEIDLVGSHAGGDATRRSSVSKKPG